MATWKHYSDSFNTQVGDIAYNTYRESMNGHAYLVGVNLESVKDEHFIQIFHPATDLGDNTRAVAQALKDPDNIYKILLDGSIKFPFKEFMDPNRIIENIEKMVNTGMEMDHAMNTALLAEYGIVGINGSDFAHRYSFDELVSKLEKTFPEGPPIRTSKAVDTASLSVTINKETGVVGGGLQSPPEVDGNAALHQFANVTVGHKHVANLDV